MKKVLVIKINEKFEGEALRERAEKAWKINPKRLDEVDYVIVLNEYKVLAEYVLGENVIYHLSGVDKGRVELILNDIKEPREFTFRGQSIGYRTSNPCTIKTEKELKELIM